MRKIVFMNTCWMDRYEGLSSGDKASGGGSFVKEKGYGHEIYNFLPINGKYYGYVQPTGHDINLGRLGAKENESFIDDVLVLWTAKKPSGGLYIVGWYKYAKVYRELQFLKNSTKRTYKNEDFGYYAETTVENAKLLPRDERIFKIPTGKNGKGQSNVWYADSPENNQFQEKVIKYVYENEIQIEKPSMSGKSIQLDPLKRKKIEEKAIKIVFEYYSKLGYLVNSFEKDNVGWDLEAVKDKEKLLIEVKGLSGNAISSELTPNEYNQMKQNKDNYRICIVTDALQKDSKLNIFAYSNEVSSWIDSANQKLSFKEFTAAKIYYES